MGSLEEVHDPDGDHRRRMDLSKLTFAIKLIAWALIGIVGLSAAQTYIPALGEPSLAPAIDTLKLIATTALGFVFGRSLGKGDS